MTAPVLELRVLIADDHPSVRAGVRALVSQLTGVTVVGDAADGRDALRLMRALAPDVVLMDIDMPGLNGLEATLRAKRLRPAPKVIILSMHAAEGYVREALRAGASGYVLKSAEVEELEDALRTVVRGGRYISSVLPQAFTAERGPAAAPALSSRQREVLQLVAEGHTSRAIAERLHVSLKTIETHREHIMHRLGIHDVAGLTLYALRAGLIVNEDGAQ